MSPLYDKLVGDFQWGALFMPTVPWGKSTRKMPFFGRNDETPLFVAVIMGLQHAFAMLGGGWLGELLILKDTSLPPCRAPVSLPL